jgi:RHS repeat-associated protein
VDVSARRYRYVGLERDDETGLYAMGARYYAAWLGRWTSADPLGIGADGPGVYNYTRGSPVVYVDPGGMEKEKPAGLPDLSVFGVDTAEWAEKFKEHQAQQHQTKVEGYRDAGETLLSLSGVIGIGLSAVLPDSAKEAIGGAGAKHSERSMGPLALLAPVTSLEDAKERGDALVEGLPGMAYPGIAIGNSVSANVDEVTSADTPGDVAHGVAGLVFDAFDVGAALFGLKSSLGAAPAPKGSVATPRLGPYRSPSSSGPSTAKAGPPPSGGGPAGGGPTAGGPPGGPTGGGAPDLLGLLKARLRQQAGFADEGTPVILDENISKKGMADALRGRGFNVPVHGVPC